jgi:hypothetical protein
VLENIYKTHKIYCLKFPYGIVVYLRSNAQGEKKSDMLGINLISKKKGKKQSNIRKNKEKGMKFSYSTYFACIFDR